MVEFASDYSKMLDWEARAMNTVLWLKGFVWDFAINILKSWTGSAELQKLCLDWRGLCVTAQKSWTG